MMVRRGASHLKRSRDAKKRRLAESAGERDARLEEQRRRDAERRAVEDEAERFARLEEQRQRQAEFRAAEDEAERITRLEEQRQRQADCRRGESVTRLPCVESIVPFSQLQVNTTIGDGNCFFHAVCDQLRGTPHETDAATLRHELACRAVELLPQLVANGIIAPDCADEIANSSFQEGVYISDEVAALFSSCFDMDLVIYQSNGNVLQYFKCDKQPPNATVRVLLSHEHYESLRLRPSLQASSGAECPRPMASGSKAVPVDIHSSCADIGASGDHR